MDVVVTIRPETAEDSVTVTISEDQGWLYRELLPRR